MNVIFEDLSKEYAEFVKLTKESMKKSLMKYTKTFKVREIDNEMQQLGHGVAAKILSGRQSRTRL